MSTPRRSLQFTETMRGLFTFGAPDPPTRIGRSDAADALSFRVTVATDDIDQFVADERHPARMSGYVHCDALGGRLAVDRGVFNLFVDAGPGHKRMLYRLFFHDSVDRPLTLIGYKDVHTPALTSIWPETSTLYLQILRGHVDSADEHEAEIVGSGLLRIHIVDFLQQLTTFRAGGSSVVSRTGALVAFGRLFVGQILEVMAGRKAAHA